MSYHKINEQTWPRRMHCEIFRQSVQPQFSVCLELDITGFYRFLKEQGYPFSLAFIHTVTTCANEIENFRYRFLDGEVVLYDMISTSFTYIHAAGRGAVSGDQRTDAGTASRLYYACPANHRRAGCLFYRATAC